MPEREADPSGVLFHTVLTPRRSAGRCALRVVIGLAVTVLSLIGLGFVAAGAWPVIGFCGLEVGLLYGALRLHGRAAGVAETLSLTRQSLVVRRTRPGGSDLEWTFAPYWLRVELAESAAGSRLILCSHGRSLALGAFLTEDERQTLAHHLIEALAPLSGIAAIARAVPPLPNTPSRPARVRSG